MNGLCLLMKHRQLTAEIFGNWVSRHYAWIHVAPPKDPRGVRMGLRAEPRSKESARERVAEFDAFLLHPDTHDCRFIRAIIGLRNVFALSAGMSTPVTVVLGLEPVASVVPAPRKARPARPAAGSSWSELLGRLLDAPLRSLATSF